MIRALKQAYLLFLALSLNLILADCNFIGNTLSYQINDNQWECPDNSGITFDSNSLCFDFDLCICDSREKPLPPEMVVELVPELITNFKSRTATFIWQPPK